MILKLEDENEKIHEEYEQGNKNLEIRHFTRGHEQKQWHIIQDAFPMNKYQTNNNDYSKVVFEFPN